PWRMSCASGGRLPGKPHAYNSHTARGFPVGVGLARKGRGLPTMSGHRPIDFYSPELGNSIQNYSDPNTGYSATPGLQPAQPISRWFLRSNKHSIFCVPHGPATNREGMVVRTGEGWPTRAVPERGEQPEG